MTTPLARREFLGAAAIAAAGLAGLARPDLPRTAAVEPIQRGGGHKFKFSMAAYSYRDLLQAKSGKKLTLEDFVLDCAKLKLEGTELTSYYFPAEPTPDYLRKLKKLAFDNGLDVSGTAVGNDFCVPPGAKRDQQIAHVKQWVDYAAILGAPVIRIFSGNAQGGLTAEESHRLAVAGMEECCQYAGEQGVYLALENHGGLTATPARALALVRDVKSPWFGFNLDTGNFHGADVYADLAQLAPYAVNVQIKISIQPAGGKRQPADLNRLAKLLTDSGYRGYIVLEYEEAGDPIADCARYVEDLRNAFGG